MAYANYTKVGEIHFYDNFSMYTDTEFYDIYVDETTSKIKFNCVSDLQSYGMGAGMEDISMLTVWANSATLGSSPATITLPDLSVSSMAFSTNPLSAYEYTDITMTSNGLLVYLVNFALSGLGYTPEMTIGLIPAQSSGNIIVEKGHIVISSALNNIITKAK